MTVKAVKPDPTPEPDPPIGIDSLTVAETAMAERKAGQSIQTINDLSYPRAGLLGALGWVLLRRTDQRITYEQYMSSRTLVETMRELGMLDEADEDDDEAEGKDDAG